MTMSVSRAVRVMMCFAGKLRCRNSRFFYLSVCHRVCLEVSPAVTRVLDIGGIIIIIIIIIKAQRFSWFSKSTSYKPSISYSLFRQKLSNYAACIEHHCFLRENILARTKV